MKTAKALGLTVPPSVPAFADEAIETARARRQAPSARSSCDTVPHHPRAWSSKKQEECSMGKQIIGRRSFLVGAGAVATGAAATFGVEGLAQETVAVPNSTGTAPPQLKVLAGACDCHHHIYDARFPFSRPGARMVTDSRVSDYRLLQRRLGTTRNIVVTPVPFPASVADNLVTLDALKAFGANARGVAIVYPEITDAELKTLADGGVRGIRFSLAAAGASPSIPTSLLETIESLSKRVDAVGWHVQFNIDATQIVAIEALLNRVPSQIVLDHMGHMPQPTGIEHPAYKVVRRLIDKGRTWVKLSVTYDSSKIGPPTYGDVNKVGEAYVKAASERMLWGSNWPHPNETPKPDDARLLDLLAEWAPSEATRRRILIENPEILYGFAKTG
jgi:D-galactarolactone isomerase